jgi:2-dehydro-3-deoxyphosphogluconate aldolase/(4S)-4-hydroxy-2-oxoglutarate aldolase
MTYTKEAVIQRLIGRGIVAIIRTTTAEPVLQIAEALIKGGVTAIEVTLTTPNALAAITAIIDRFGEVVLVGVGSVLTVAQCRDAISAGARYVISPNLSESVIQTAGSLGAVSIPGAYTPSEIVHAAECGADLVKIFPATALGPGYLRDVLAPLPHLRLMPTGGVSVTNVGQWFAAGATCVGVGSSLVSQDVVNRGEWEVIAARATAFREAMKAVRGTTPASHK